MTHSLHHAGFGGVFAILLAAVAAQADNTPPPGPINKAITHATQAVVKIYGPSAGRENDYGTGVIVSSDGHILTTLSLLVSTRESAAVLPDGRSFVASLVRSDESRQLALLKIHPDGLPHITPKSSQHLQSGDMVIALGNWFGIAEKNEPISINRGILSLRTTLEARRLAQKFEYGGTVLVYDAITANPGAAGGPLLDLDGNFVGLIGEVIESAYTRTRLNYAIPGEELIAFLDDKPSTESELPIVAENNSTGAEPVDLGIRLAKLGFRHVSAFVERVRPGSPADRAGVRVDDLIIAVNGRRIDDASDYEQALEKLAAGSKISLTVKRGEAILILNVETGAAQ